MVGIEPSIYPKTEGCFSAAIGSKFNLEKTDVKAVGSPDFKAACYENKSMNGAHLPGAYILDPHSPLRLLGVWVGSLDYAEDRWLQVESHVKKLIRQWRAIGTSARNR